MINPIIGVTAFQVNTDQNLPVFGIPPAYVDALIQAGGVPVLIPSRLSEKPLQELVDRLDGILFTGGGDISIDRFNGEPHSRVYDVDEERDNLEFSLLDSFINNKKPFLGICRGFQVINVGMGGTLYTHIQDQMPGALRHDYYPEYPCSHLAHMVKVDVGSSLANILGETALSVNSLHHQGAKDIPSTLKRVAYAPDGLVEAVELPDHPFGIGVQWHPEGLTDQLAARRLFQAFVEAAGNHR